MKLREARDKADSVIWKLTPFCECIQVAGSILRECAECGDIEIVCIPLRQPASVGLFGEVEQGAPVDGFIQTINAMRQVKGTPYGKYTQRLLPDGTQVDIFMARPENWGLILAIRTGSAAFSHTMLAKRWVNRGYESKDGMLCVRKTGEQIPIRSELELFRRCDLKWIHPRERNA